MIDDDNIGDKGDSSPNLYIQVEFLRKYCYIEDLDENKACKIVTIVIRGSRASPICGHYKPYPSIYLRSVYIKL